MISSSNNFYLWLENGNINFFFLVNTRCFIILLPSKWERQGKEKIADFKFLLKIYVNLFFLFVFWFCRIFFLSVEVNDYGIGLLMLFASSVFVGANRKSVFWRILLPFFLYQHWHKKCEESGYLLIITILINQWYCVLSWNNIVILRSVFTDLWLTAWNQTLNTTCCFIIIFYLFSIDFGCSLTRILKLKLSFFFC